MYDQEQGLGTRDWGLGSQRSASIPNPSSLIPQSCLPWQCLYFLPDPHGQSALRATLPQVEGSLGSRAAAALLVCSGDRLSAARPAATPGRAPAAIAASAIASSSSPLKGSTWWACIGGSSTGSNSSSGGPVIARKCIRCPVTCSRRLASMVSNSSKLSLLYSLSGSRWP